MSFGRGKWCQSTILDCNKAWAGFHESDLARLDLWQGMIGEWIGNGCGSLDVAKLLSV